MSTKAYKAFNNAIDTRLCQLCGEPIPEGAGIGHSDLELFVHFAVCGDRINAIRKIYDRSKKGRWRPISEIRRLLELDQRISNANS